MTMETIFLGHMGHIQPCFQDFSSSFFFKKNPEKGVQVPHVPRTSAASESQEGLLHQFPLITGFAFIFGLPPYPGPEPFAPGLHTPDVV